ncbi:MAG: hypothetical protein ACON42_07000 [Flavobacteriaceae bacterium]
MKTKLRKLVAVLLWMLALGAIGETIFMYRMLSFIDWPYALMAGFFSWIGYRLWIKK